MVKELEFDEELEIGEFAKLTRSYTAKGFSDLADDIERNGLKEPITLWESKILDGRHRYRACKERGVVLRYEEFVGSEDEALDFVISKSISKDSSSTASKVEAYVLCKARGIKNKDMPSRFSRLAKNDVNKLSKIEKTDEEYLQTLLEQRNVVILDCKYGVSKSVNTIHALWQIIVSNNKIASQDVKGEYIDNAVAAEESYVTTYLDDEVLEAEFWGLYNLAKEAGEPLTPSYVFGRAIMDRIKETSSLKRQKEELCEKLNSTKMELEKMKDYYGTK